MMTLDKPVVGLFSLPGYAVCRLNASNAAELQDLCERCTDYFELHEGFATQPTAGAEALADLPSGKTLEDKFSIGIYESGCSMIGHLDIMRHYPATNEWWIGLFMLDPRIRANGLGTRILGVTRNWVFSQGGRSIHGAVFEENGRAERFWRRRGFTELRRQPYTSQTGNKNTRLIVMKKNLEE